MQKLQDTILDLIDLMGGVDNYCEWLDDLEDGLSGIDFQKAIEEKMAELKADKEDAEYECNCNGIPGSHSCKKCDRAGKIVPDEELIF